MRKILLLLLFLLPISVYGQKDNFPVTGVSDSRPGTYGFKNARIVVDYLTTIDNADMLVSEGRITEIGKNIVFPAGTIVIDLTGLTVYPSFIDMYAASYGIRPQSGIQDQERTGPNTYVAQVMRLMGVQQSAEPRVADYWNDGINSAYNVSEEFIPDTKTSGEYRQAGFGAVVTFRPEGLARGTSALVTTGDGKANNLIIKDKASSNFSLSRGRSADAYPMSQFGAIALLRQLNYDAQWYKQLPPGYFHDNGLEAFISTLSLPQVFEVSDNLEVMRVCKLGKEFNINYIVKGAGDEYQSLADIRKTGCRLIVPVAFPSAPDVKDPYNAMAVPYTTLKHYEMAPANLAFLSKEGITFAITSAGMERRSDFLSNLRKSIKYGLPEAEALKALTYTPALLMNASGLVGALKKNMIANFLITSGDIFQDDCIIYENWIQGVPYRFTDLRNTDIRGNYRLIADNTEYKLSLSGTPDKPSIKIIVDSVELKGAAFTRDRDLVSISFERDRVKYRLTGYISGKDFKGDGQLDSGKWINWSAVFTSSVAAEKGKPSSQVAVAPTGSIIYPFAAYGRPQIPVRENMLIKNATVWTNEKEGILQNTDVLVTDGKIAKVGKNLRADGVRIIDGTGMHLTPGIIDEHSHIASDATNESGQAITSEVRMEDVINPQDPSIYRQLSGGVTAAHILHGSANPIGGQSVLIKHRWGHSAEELFIENQPRFLKHALGENVKRNTGRYPNTRMGVDQIIRDAYNRAIDYNKKWKEWNSLKPAEKAGKIPPRRDLELDPIVDVLEKRSYIECHTYVQSEGTMIMNLAKDYGLKVNSLIHFNEGYKVADQIKKNDAGASVFADWWDYKYEVYEGITYNAAILLSRGILTCLHSDDDEMGRRLNQEAGKIVKYGGVDEQTALKLVTLNPAKLLHIDDRMGSIRAGKDADLVLWTGHPLSVYSRASKTIIDGTVYFDEETDSEMKKQIDEERNRIIALILREPARPSPADIPNSPRR
ncbi:MAG TPA: amidohydrolase family protein [Bacteroidales bacterium]|jgi:imidazolonepropionase-like amidohydrolase|nr:amidohydrolase family protein [Bacteroidales bacterium]